MRENARENMTSKLTGRILFQLPHSYRRRTARNLISKRRRLGWSSLNEPKDKTITSHSNILVRIEDAHNFWFTYIYSLLKSLFFTYTIRTIITQCVYFFSSTLCSALLAPIEPAREPAIPPTWPKPNLFAIAPPPTPPATPVAIFLAWSNLWWSSPPSSNILSLV